MNDRSLGFVAVLILCLAALAVNESWSEHHSKQTPATASCEKALGKREASPTPAASPLRSGDETKRTIAGEESGTEFWPAFFGYRLKITDTLLVAFTALLAWSTRGLQRSTVGLQRAADEQARITNRLFVADQRPWIKATLEFVKIDYISNGSVKLGFVAKIENIGKTPAIGVSFNGLHYYQKRIDSKLINTISREELAAGASTDYQRDRIRVASKDIAFWNKRTLLAGESIEEEATIFISKNEIDNSHTAPSEGIIINHFVCMSINYGNYLGAAESYETTPVISLNFGVMGMGPIPRTKEEWEAFRDLPVYGGSLTLRTMGTRTVIT